MSGPGPTRHGRLFLDSTVPLHAVGGEHPLRGPCRAVLERAAAGEVELHASVELVQEFVFHRLRRTSRGVALEQTDALRRMLVLHPFDEQVMDAALGLSSAHGIRGRDAVHAATALGAGFDTIVSADPDLGGVPGLRRLGPAGPLD